MRATVEIKILEKKIFKVVKIVARRKGKGSRKSNLTYQSKKISKMSNSKTNMDYDKQPVGHTVHQALC